jgi:hypothetical protein
LRVQHEYSELLRVQHEYSAHWRVQNISVQTLQLFLQVL